MDTRSEVHMQWVDSLGTWRDCVELRVGVPGMCRDVPGTGVGELYGWLIHKPLCRISLVVLQVRRTCIAIAAFLFINTLCFQEVPVANRPATMGAAVNWRGG